MLIQPILAPQEVPETMQAAPSPAPEPPGTTRPAPGDSPADPPTEVAEPPQAPERGQTVVLDEGIATDDTPDLPDIPTPAPPAAQDPADVVDEPDPVPALDDVVDEELPSLPDAPADALVHRDRLAAPDPRSTGRSTGSPDAAARPDRGKPVFPAGWPWHERLGNQGNGQGWGPPSRSG